MSNEILIRAFAEKKDVLTELSDEDLMKELKSRDVDEDDLKAGLGISEKALSDFSFKSVVEYVIDDVDLIEPDDATKLYEAIKEENNIKSDITVQTELDIVRVCLDKGNLLYVQIFEAVLGCLQNPNVPVLEFLQVLNESSTLGGFTPTLNS
ncbi:hypothetical protein [Pinibacter soli]|uniref:Uncharacterized protein n=1 Tax=Pinibacter soli TaxID=3044211 RepID=A0ABT6RBP5_9BACT|nr:hypothetical protein [Pinibacter soli]MDI3319973.1 hypothetical protein [Pinibacter soli]